MYAVIKTGGKQYRVSPGDVLVVEKLDGEPGANVAFGEVLMLGDGAAVTLGLPTVEGASVNATLVETRKAEKIKIFKKIRRQGYRRTQGHRQSETVLRVVGITAGGKETKWEGEVSLTTKAELDARARGFDFATLNLPRVTRAQAKAAAATTTAKAPAKAKPAKVVDAEPVAEVAAEAPAKKAAAPKKAATPKADAPKPAKPSAKQAAKKDTSAE